MFSRRILITLLAIFVPLSSFAANVTLEDFLSTYYTQIASDVPESYQYIDVLYTNVHPETGLYKALQKAIYLDAFPNKAIKLPLTKELTEEYVNRFLERDFRMKFNYLPDTILTHKKLSDLLAKLPTYYQKRGYDADKQPDKKNNISREESFELLNDVYTNLLQHHYNQDNYDSRDLIDGAIRGMMEITEDKYTIYYTPEEAASFHRSFEGEFEWIGAYLEKIGDDITVDSPVPGSPAQKAGLKPGDIILKIDDFVIKADTPVYEAVEHVLGPKWSKVTLQVKRGTEILEINITRGTIVLDAMVYKKLGNGDLYIDINSFNMGLEKEFEKAAIEIARMNPSKIIIDVTGNPGGSMDAADRILHYFVPMGEPTVHIKQAYQNYDLSAKSVPESQFFGDKEIVIMIDDQSASASEVLAITIKDYAKDVTIVGTKSFGKWSVQRLDEYNDGAMYKFTIAKWFSGKSHTGIDGVGIEPDVEVEDKPETEINEILQKAMQL